MLACALHEGEQGKKKKTATHLNQNVVPHGGSVLIHEFEKGRIERRRGYGKPYKAATGG